MLFLIFILCLTSLSSQNIWEVRLDLNGTPEESVIKKIEVIDSNNIYMISTRGTPNYLYKSTNNGSNWFLLNDLTKYNVEAYRDIEVFDSLIYISFYGGIILKSTDFGSNFEKIDIGYNNFIDDLIMFDDRNGIANMPVKFYKTYDGWKTFDTIQLPFILNSHVIKKYNDTLSMGILSNFGKELQESNEPGKTYIYQRQFFRYNFLTDEFITINFPDMSYLEIEFANDSVFYLCGKKDGITGGSGHDAVFKSTDAGKTWRTILDLYTGWSNGKVVFNRPFGLQDIAFKNDSVGIAVGQFGKILYTYDGGESWFYEQNLPRIIDSLSPPTMLVTYAGDRAIIGDFTGAIHTLEVDNLAPKPEDTLTISGKIISDDSLAITHIPIRLNSNRITMTDEEGNYKFTKLSPGTYSVTALNKYIDSGPKEDYHYEPFLYSPVHSFELTSDTSGIDFESELKYGKYFIFGYVLSDSVGVEGIKVNFDSLDGGSTYSTVTDKDGLYRFDSIIAGYYKLLPKSETYKIEPLEKDIFLIQNHGYFNFEASPISSIKENKNFEIKNNVLISKEFVGMQYHIFSLTGRVINSGILPKELNLNAEQTGTYILHVTKGEQMVFTHKFQVVR